MSASKGFRDNWWKFAAFGLLVAGLAVTGYWRMFTQFMAYDDEGCFLWSLTNYFSAGGLYDRVQSWYGPFYFTFNHLLHVLTGLDFNHDTGRSLTLFYWCATVLVCGLLTWQQTRSLCAGLASTTLTFIALITVIREPMHPSGFVMLAVALAALAGGTAVVRGRPVVFAGTVALLGTAMILTKINVGAFFAIAAVTWLAINSRAAARSLAIALLTALACGAVPLLLMRAEWPNPWVTGYVLIFTCGALALTAALHAAHQPEYGIQSALLGLAVAFVFGGLVLVAASAHGTSWIGLWKGIVAAPSSFAEVHYMALNWPAGARELALLQLLAAGAFYFCRATTGVLPAVAAVRIAAGVWFFARVPSLFSDATSLQSFCFSYGPSLAWLMVVPLTSTVPTAADRARLWLAWVFVWQTLQAYPVPGSQVGWGSFLWVPLFVVGWHEAAVFWAERLRVSRRKALVVTASSLLSTAMLALWPIAQVGYRQFTANEPLGLPGSSHLRLDGNIGSDFRILQQNIQAHGNLLYTHPAMFSLNLWTGRRPPTLPRGTPEAYERALFDQFESDPRAVFVVNHYWIELTMLKGAALPEAVFRYFNEHFVPVLQVDSFGLWVRRGRTVAPLSIARLLPASAAQQIRIEFITGALAQPVAALEFVQLDPEPGVLERVRLDATRPWQRMSVSESGAAVGSTAEGTGPMTISSLSRVMLPFTPAPHWPSLNSVEIRLLAANGRVLDRLRFADKLSWLPVTKDQKAGADK
jgi:hypothetical protein